MAEVKTSDLAARLRWAAGNTLAAGHAQLLLDAAAALDRKDAALQGALEYFRTPYLEDDTSPPIETVEAALNETGLCEGCPPVGYPTDKTRCDPCPRRKTHVKPTEAVTSAPP